MIDPLLAFAASMTILFLLIALHIEVYIAISAATIVYGVLTLSPQGFFTSIFRAFTNLYTYRVVAVFILALFMSHVMRSSGLLEKTTRTFARVGCRFAGYSVPAVIGLIPMPGGALVSAMTLREHYFEKMRLDPNFGAYLNYWFRHIWVSVWPVYQSMIITSAILGVSVYEVISATYPITLAAILSGLIVSTPSVIRSNKCGKGEVSIRMIVEGLWPFVSIAILALVLKLPVSISLALTLAAVLLVLRPKGSSINAGLKFALDPKLMVIVIMVMIYRELIVESNAAQALYIFLANHNIPVLVAAFLIPFLIGVTTSGEFVYASTAFPLMMGILLTGSAINRLPMLVAYMGGFLGVMASPVHLCLVLTAQYYNALYRKIYLYLTPTIIFTGILAILLGYILFGI